MAILKVKIDAKQLEKELGAIAQRSKNLRPAYQAIGNYLVGETQDRIKRETSPDGTPFAPLKLSTRKAKERKGKIRKILQQEGTLVATIAAQVQGDGVAIGSNLPYASIHQLGGEAGRNKAVDIPARPYLGLNDDDQEEVTGIVEDWLLLGQ